MITESGNPLRRSRTSVGLCEYRKGVRYSVKGIQHEQTRERNQKVQFQFPHLWDESEARYEPLCSTDCCLQSCGSIIKQDFSHRVGTWLEQVCILTWANMTCGGDGLEICPPRDKVYVSKPWISLSNLGFSWEPSWLRQAHYFSLGVGLSPLRMQQKDYLACATHFYWGHRALVASNISFN